MAAQSRKQEEALIELMKSESKKINRIHLPKYPLNQQIIDLIINVNKKRPPIVMFNLSHNQLDEKTLINVIESLAELSSLERLNLSGNLFTERAVKSLTMSVGQSIKNVNLSGTQINGSKLSYLLNSLDKITHLTLSNNSIDDDDCFRISQFLKRSKLKSLNLRRNQITDRGAISILRSFNLSNLSLSNNQIGDRAIAELADILEVDNSLVKLVLAQNLITNRGVEYLSQALKVNSGLRSISLVRNNLDDQCSDLFLETLKVNYTLMSIKLFPGQQPPELKHQLNDILNRRNRLESLQSKCARLIKREELNCSIIPRIVKSCLSLY